MNTDGNRSGSKDTLKSFLKEAIEAAREMLKSLKGTLKADDFNSLDARLNEMNVTLDSLQDEDQTQLFILRRQIDAIRENIESLAVKKSLWSRMPLYVRILMISFPVILYLCLLAAIQRLNRDEIYNYPATQTAFAAQTLPAAQATPTPAPTQAQ